MWADATGTRQRLQALTAAGWSTRQLAELLGVTSNAIAQLRTTGQARVLASTAADIDCLYQRLWWRTPPGRYQTRCERHSGTAGSGRGAGRVPILMTRRRFPYRISLISVSTRLRSRKPSPADESR